MRHQITGEFRLCGLTRLRLELSLRNSGFPVTNMLETPDKNGGLHANRMV